MRAIARTSISSPYLTQMDMFTPGNMIGSGMSALFHRSGPHSCLVTGIRTDKMLGLLKNVLVLI